MPRSLKSSTVYSILIALCVVGFWFFDNFYTPSSYSANNESLSDGSFPEKLMPSSTTGALVHHSYFSLSYQEEYEQAEWVAYTLTKQQITGQNRKRPYFIEDPFVATKSADWRNYKGSGYDRGHLVPAGDRKFSEQAFNETFYTSNISPQDRDFNAGLWNRLEQQTRRWAKRYGIVHVVTGGVLVPRLPRIGSEDVAVPSYFYKIIAKQVGDEIQTLAFLMEAKEEKKDLTSYVVSVDEIEMLTGVDFFYKLPEKEQARIEADVVLDYWSF